MTRIAFQTAMRTAAVAFLEDYRDSAGITLSVYRARPRHLAPPHAFVESIGETISYTALNQRQPRAEIVVVHGLFDSGAAADQRDGFIDGLIDWSFDRFHQAGANTTVAIVSIDDDPVYVPDWLPEGERQSYYATRITLEGLALSG